MTTDSTTATPERPTDRPSKKARGLLSAAAGLAGATLVEHFAGAISGLLMPGRNDA